MNACACAAGAAKTATTATVAAINLESMSIILLKIRREIGRTAACGQPIQTTHAKVKYACGACGNPLTAGFGMGGRQIRPRQAGETIKPSAVTSIVDKPTSHHRR